jgi:phosphoglucosamine mutase
MTKRAYFGTDGIRGEANVHPMTAHLATRLGQALGLRFRAQGSHERIIIGKDTRLSGYLFESALTAGITSAGAEAWQVGVLPTPGIAYITGAFRAKAGVVISASHNPFHDNGMKVFGADGFKLPDSMEVELEALLDGNELDLQLPRGGALGRAFRVHDALGRYVTYLKSTFPRHLSLEGIKVVVDCANGAAYRAAPAMLRELGADVVELGTSPNGTNINQGNGALFPERMAETVRALGAHLGIALDGDGDRVMLACDKGNIVDGDHVLAICGSRLKARGELPGNTVVGTVMSNLGLERALERLGISLLRTQVGDRYVVEAMRERNLILGGEQSGHLVFMPESTTGDGCLSALRVLSVMLEEERPLSELAAIVQKVPQVLLNVRVRDRRPIDELEPVKRAIAAAEEKLGRSGRVLVRYSGTEPKVRVMIEGEDRATIDDLAQQIAVAFRHASGE